MKSAAIHPGCFVRYAPTGELGRVKRKASDTSWFVWFSTGETAAPTSAHALTAIADPYGVPSMYDPYALGGAAARRLFGLTESLPCDALLASNPRFSDRALCPSFGGPDCPFAMRGALCTMTPGRLASTLGAHA